jgi:hypothetical protein
MSTTVVLLIVAFVALVLIKSGALKHAKSTRQGRGLSSSAQDSTPALHWPALGDFEFEVVGESNYQAAIASLAGNHGTQSADLQCVAAIEPEDDNPHDPKAVLIRIQGKVVGYLSRQDARSFRRRLGQKGLSGRVTTCDALIVGGGTRRSGEKLHYGVKLDIKPFE